MFDQCLYFNASALARRLEREWAEAFEPFGVTPPQGFMLRAILDRPGMLQRELSEALSIARPTATRALDGLGERGYIERRRVEGDGREVAIYPTVQALAIRQPLDDASGEVTARLTARMGGSTFADTVHKIRAVRSVLE